MRMCVCVSEINCINITVNDMSLKISKRDSKGRVRFAYAFVVRETRGKRIAQGVAFGT